MTSSRGRLLRGLVADDDPLIRKVMRGALESHGIDVVEASSGEEAVAVADSVDFAVIDARMPGLSLADTVAALRARHRIPLLVISGGIPGQHLSPDIDYLMKPFDLDVFLSSVDRLVATAMAHGEGKAFP